MTALNQQRVAEMKAGQEAAYEWLLDCFEKPVYRFLLCSVKNESLAIELSGEVFGEFVLALKAGRLRDPSRLAGFVFGIARNVLRRTHKRKREVPLDQIPSVADLPAGMSAVPEQTAAREELGRAMYMIHELRALDRQIMLLRFVEGLKIKTIAATLDIPINTVKVTIHRCRQKIQTDLQYEC
ncbi:RNA polymerase sigma factor [Planctomycetota bacterium]